MDRIFRFAVPAAALVAGCCLLYGEEEGAGTVAKADAAKTADTYRGQGLTATLVSEVKEVRAGEPFWAGLHIRHDPGFHTYWSNPGVAGVAPRITWKLPDGWTSGPLMFPPPDKVKMAAYDTHGYERDVLLLTKITPAGQPALARLEAEIVWMCCGATCHPGYKTFSLTLPVTAAAKEPALDKEWHEKFEQARGVQPPEAEGWKFVAVRDGDKIVLTGKPPQAVKAPAQPHFFSGDNLINSNAPQEWKMSEDGGFSAELSVYEFAPKDTSKLAGLLFGKDGWQKGGKAPYVQINVPVTGASAPAGKAVSAAAQ